MKKCSVLFTIWLALGAINPTGWHFGTGRLEAQQGPNPNPPTISDQSRSALVTPGSDVTLFVGAEGEGRISIQWFFNGASIRNQKGPELTIREFGPENVGTYYAIVENDGGSVRTGNMNISLRREGPTGIGFLWASQLSPIRAGLHRPNDIVTDAEGNVYVVGEAPNESGNADFVIVKYDRNGAEQWVRYVDPSEGSDDEAVAVAIHQNGSIIVLGTAGRRSSNSPVAGNGFPQIVLMSLSPSNELNWLSSLTSAETRASEASELALAPNGDVLVTGTALGPANQDIVTGRFNREGTQQWVELFDGGGRDLGASVATDSSGNVFVVGTSRAEETGDDIMGIFYNQRGTLIWNQRHTATDNHDDQGVKALFDSSNQALIVGAIELENTGLDFFVARHSPAGNLQFTATETSRGRIDDIPVDAALDSSDAILVTGNSLRNNPGSEGMIVKINNRGAIDWARSIPALGRPGDQINDLALPGDGGPIVAGAKFSPTLGRDIFSSKFNSGGSSGFEIQLPLIPDAPVFGAATAITIDPRGDLLLAGVSNTSASGGGSAQGTETLFVTIKMQITPPRQNALPSIRIVSPLPNQTFEVDQEVEIFVTANDQDGPVARVEILVGNKIIGDFQSAPFRTTWVVDTIDPVLITARVTDSDGAVITADTPIDVTITDISPEIIAFPSDQTVTPGATLNLVAQVTGREPLQFRWFQNGQPLRNQNGPTLTIENFGSSNAGTYELAVENRFGRDRSESISIELDIPSVIAGDDLADRVSLAGESGQVKVSTIGATRELGEPVHAGKRSNHSVWFSYVAAAQGLVEISTIGANFDTLLAVYTGTSFDNLVSVASDEDRGGRLTSELRFRAESDQEYLIVVDGFNQHEGTAVLTWSLNRTVTVQVPRFTVQPDEVVARRGNDVTFTANIQGPRPAGVTLQWFFNDREIEGATGPQLVIQDVQPNEVGNYTVQATLGNVQATSSPATLALAARRAVNALVVPEVKLENKFADIFFAFAGPNAQGLQQQRRRRPIPLAASLATGFSGAQIFNTFGAVKEIGEPDHCDVPGGASQWFAYQPPIDGTVSMSTEGSDFDTVMAVYVTDSSDFSSLQEVACDNDSGFDGTDSLLSFDATASTIYYVAIDGVEAATGVVALSYAMDLPLELTLTAGGGLSFGGEPSSTVTQFIYTITAPQNVDFVIESSEDLITWTTVTTAQVGEDGTYQFQEDQFDLGTRERYFRVYYP